MLNSEPSGSIIGSVTTFENDSDNNDLFQSNNIVRNALAIRFNRSAAWFNQLRRRNNGHRMRNRDGLRLCGIRRRGSKGRRPQISECRGIGCQVRDLLRAKEIGKQGDLRRSSTDSRSGLFQNNNGAFAG